ncbi:TetR/AcrR family transcriptional regulator [Streptomyces sp. 8P21H-1]|uniref:TetR/AcrR family transcriptional regulator n=1 Tax=Streptomyces sp. 8P21H-1 TaxID=2737048 RepID=UPI001C2D95A4
MLDSAYRCFCRNGFRRTTISSIVEESRLSRPTVYKYVGTKDEAFARIVRGLLEGAAAAAEEVAATATTPEEKVLAVLTVKLEVAIRLWQDSPAYAYELLSAATVHIPEVVTSYVEGLAELLTTITSEFTPEAAQQVTSVLLTFTRGLEDDLRDPEAARRDLKIGVGMIMMAGTMRGRPAPGNGFQDSPGT